MEDKEREFYLQWITEVMRANIQLTTNLMQLAMTNMMNNASTMMPTPSMMINKDQFNDLFKSMTGTGTDDFMKNFNKKMFGSFRPDDKDKLT